MLEETHLADPSPDPDTDDGGAGHNRGPAPGTPRWPSTTIRAVRHLTELRVALRAALGDSVRVRRHASTRGTCRGVKPVSQGARCHPRDADAPNPESYADNAHPTG